MTAQKGTLKCPECGCFLDRIRHRRYHCQFCGKEMFMHSDWHLTVTIDPDIENQIKKSRTSKSRDFEEVAKELNL